MKRIVVAVSFIPHYPLLLRCIFNWDGAPFLYLADRLCSDGDAVAAASFSGLKYTECVNVPAITCLYRHVACDCTLRESPHFTGNKEQNWKVGCEEVKASITCRLHCSIFIFHLQQTLTRGHKETWHKTDILLTVFHLNPTDRHDIRLCQLLIWLRYHKYITCQHFKWDILYFFHGEDLRLSPNCVNVTFLAWR